MDIKFCGAAKMVTGSCFLVTSGGHKILVDCGMQQGRDEIDQESFPFNANEIEYVIVTHAHIDHSGRLPLLVKRGFSGIIFTTRLTAELLSIMLRDSAYIQESEAQWENRKGKRAGKNEVEPLYTIADAERVAGLISGMDYGMTVDIVDGIKLRFTDAGHLLGSASAELWLTENGTTKKVLFSGDLGNINQPIVRDPQPVSEADYVIIESTYGDREHDMGDFRYTEELAEIMDSTFAKGGNVIIPSFAVGRTQELLYYIREMKERGLVKSKPDFEVYVDSPLANEATKIYSGDLRGFVDSNADEIIKNGGELFEFEGLRLSESSEESKALNTNMTPKVIISASGMCDAGRIRHHLKHNLWRPESTVVFVGFQSPGSLGRLLLDGAPKVKLFGEEIAVAAKIINFKGMSAHADRSGLLRWISSVQPMPEHVFVVHGESETTEIFAQTLRERGIAAHAPDYEEIYDLTLNRMLEAGVEPTPKKKKAAVQDSPAFIKLVAIGNQLLEVIQRNRGGTNKDLGRFAEQIKSLVEKWNR